MYGKFRIETMETYTSLGINELSTYLCSYLPSHSMLLKEDDAYLTLSKLKKNTILNIFAMITNEFVKRILTI